MEEGDKVCFGTSKVLRMSQKTEAKEARMTRVDYFKFADVKPGLLIKWINFFLPLVCSAPEL